MSNPYYNNSASPSTGSAGASSVIRAEFASIAAGFALLPTLSGFGNKAVVVNSGGTALTTTTGSLVLAGNLTTTGAFNLTFALGATVVLTAPAVDGTLATLAGTETFTNKTLTSPVLGGTVVGSYTLAGSPTLNAATLTGTFVGTYTLAGTPTITAPAISAPTFSGTAAGSLTNMALTTPTITSPIFAGVVTSHVLFTDATYDIGASGATRPRDLFLSRHVVIGGNLTVAGTFVTAPLGKHLEGLTYANNAGDATNDIDIAVGSAASTHATPASRVLLSLTTALTKRLDASWVTGTNQGGLSSSLSIGNNDYYIHLIRVGGVDDIGFDTSVTASNLVTDHSATHYRLIGWMKRVAGIIVAFTTYETAGGGLELLWTTPTLEVDLSNTLTTSRRTDAVKVPLNFSVLAHLNVAVNDAVAPQVLVYCPDQADLVPSTTAAPLSVHFSQAANTSGGQIYVRTSAAGLIAARSLVATTSVYKVSTIGFTWARRN